MKHASSGFPVIRFEKSSMLILEIVASSIGTP
jgi:hypothetical protein